MFILTSCENEVEAEISSQNCVATLANARVELSELNGCTLSSGANGSTFGVILDYEGECVDEQAQLVVGLHWYDEKGGVELSSSYVTYDYGNFGHFDDQIFAEVCVRYGASAEYVEFEVYFQNLLGNSAIVGLERPEGAN